MASGTIRGDQVYPPGVLRMKDIMTCFPFEDPVVVLKVTGQALLDALENSVSTYPALEGRFPQVAGITFEYDPRLPPNKRVLRTKVRAEPVDRNKIYKLATRGYMARGKDGFESLLAKSEGGVAEEVVSEENGILISTLLRQYFLSMKILGRWRRMISLHGHWDGVMTSNTLHRREKRITGRECRGHMKTLPPFRRQLQSNSTMVES
jgi:5'-nucleotidase